MSTVRYVYPPTGGRRKAPANALTRDQRDALFADLGGYLVALCRRFEWLSLTEAEDLAQDALLAAVRRLHGWDPSRLPFRLWLYWIARGVARDAAARNRRPKRFPPARNQTTRDGADRLAAVPDPHAGDPAAIAAARLDPAD